jgi:signal transduction histidine kinase
MQSEDLILTFGTLLFLFLAGFIALFAAQYRKEQLKFTIEKQRFKQEILQAEIEIRENTLQDVGKELHDNLGQIAALTRINLAGMLSGNAKPEKIQYSISLMDTLINEMRSLSHQLNDGIQMKRNLLEQISLDANRLKNIEGLTVKIDLEAPSLGITNDQAILIYRIFQEGLSNVLKHARATELIISAKERNDSAELTLEDNGVGLLAGKADQDGIGMTNMQSRAALLGADLSISQRNQGGTILSIKINKAKLKNDS